jgi:hypothetical protein
MATNKDSAAETAMVPATDWGNVQWQTAVAESGDQIVFDKIGDEFIGQFVAARTAQNDGEDFTILTFIGVDGKPYQTNAGWKLQEGFSDIEPGTIVRITYVKDVDTGRKDPMKDYRIEVAVTP